MPLAELNPQSAPSDPTRESRRTRIVVVGASGIIAGAVGYAAAVALGCATTCATGRSPITFALLIGLTAAIGAASAVAQRR